MKNIDVEIYLKNVFNFFEENPQELKKLIGDIPKNNFFDKIEETAYTNYKNNGDMVLSRNQIIDITVELFKQRVGQECFEHTKVGVICLN
jgi:hypothetical protein